MENLCFFNSTEFEVAMLMHSAFLRPIISEVDKNISLKDQMVSTLGFVGYKFSVTALLCC